MGIVDVKCYSGRCTISECNGQMSCAMTRRPPSASLWQASFTGQNVQCWRELEAAGVVWDIVPEMRLCVMQFYQIRVS